MDSIDGFRCEIADALPANTGQLGAVFACWESGIHSPNEIASHGAAANGGAAGNLLVQIEAALDRTVPVAPSRARQAASALRSLRKSKRKFHRLLDSAGHVRSRSGAGREWFATSVEFLDTIAEVLGLEVSGDDPQR